VFREKMLTPFDCDQIYAPTSPRKIKARSTLEELMKKICAVIALVVATSPVLAADSGWRGTVGIHNPKKIS
jgi:hypothetical protein